jgi:UDP:flavonoid glycosyltransferase YjiC (YdhE family)
MTKILYTNGNGADKGALGPLVRMIAVGEEVQSIDPSAQVAFRASTAEKPYLEKSGFTVFDGYKPYLFGLPALIGMWITISLERNPGRPIPEVPNMEFVLRLKGMLNRKYVEATFREETALLEKFRPDVIFGSMDLIMPIVARLAGIPYVVLGTAVMLPGYKSPLFPSKEAQDYTGLINPLLRRQGLPLVRDIKELLCSYFPAQVVIPSIPELEDMPPDGKNLFIGSLLPNRILNQPFAWEKKRPLVFVYLSIGQLTPQKYMKVLVESFARSEFDVVVAAGDHPAFQGKNVITEGNVHFYRVIPSEEILPLCDLAIHHGGQNTTVQCIQHAVPSLIFPGMHFERHYNATKAAEAGCARCLSNADFRVEVLLRLAREASCDSTMRARLADVSQRIKAAGGRYAVARTLLSY